jgi:DNA-binding response OmpR family regulator
MNSETPERRRSLPDPLPPTSPAYLSAEDLLEQVWDEHADPFTNAVAVTISRLRKAAGLDRRLTALDVSGNDGSQLCQREHLVCRAAGRSEANR